MFNIGDHITFPRASSTMKSRVFIVMECHSSVTLGGQLLVVDGTRQNSCADVHIAHSSDAAKVTA